MKWRSNVKGLFEEMLENGGPSMRVMDKPLRITYAILQEAATRAMKLQDEELISIFCRLAMYEESDLYSKQYDRTTTEKLIRKFSK